MSVVQKRVVFEYYKVTYRNVGDIDYRCADGDFDLLPIIDYLKELGFEERTIEYYDELARLESLYPKKDNHMIVASLLKLRDDNIPCKATLDSESEDLGLEDDEYIGEDVSILYDPSLCVLMIQRNINSLTVKGIENYFNNFLQKTPKYAGQNIEIFLRPIAPINVQEQIASSKYIRSFNFRLAEYDTNLDTLGMRGRFRGLIDYLANFDGSHVEVNVNVGRKQNKSLNKEEIEDALESIQEIKEVNDGVITKTRVKVKKNEHTRVEEVDLFADKISDQVYVWIGKRERLNSEFFSDIMLETYLSSVDTVREALGADNDEEGRVD